MEIHLILNTDVMLRKINLAYGILIEMSMLFCLQSIIIQPLKSHCFSGQVQNLKKNVEDAPKYTLLALRMKFSTDLSSTLYLT